MPPSPSRNNRGTSGGGGRLGGVRTVGVRRRERAAARRSDVRFTAPYGGRRRGRHGGQSRRIPGDWRSRRRVSRDSQYSTRLDRDHGRLVAGSDFPPSQENVG